MLQRLILRLKIALTRIKLSKHKRGNTGDITDKERRYIIAIISEKESQKIIDEEVSVDERIDDYKNLMKFRMANMDDYQILNDAKDILEGK
jgi:hypothetical protein